MVCRGIACDECTKNCETFHRKKKHPSSIVTRFFKVIYGKDYSEVMYLPPRFAQNVKHLANQETQIEDLSGLRWSVTLSYVDGLLAFRKGWPKFFVDHGLKEDQLLVFNYIKGSHFVVQIYGQNGCERTSFNNGRPRRNKRSRRDPEIVFQDELFQSPDVNSRDKFSSVASGSDQNHHAQTEVANADPRKPQTDSISIDMEDPTCIINRDDGCNQGEARNFLYDLSSFEMEKETCDANKFEKALHTEKSPSLAETVEYADKFEKVLNTETAPHHTGIMKLTKTNGDDTQMPVINTNQITGCSGDIFTEKFEKALETGTAPSHADIAEKSRKKRDDTRMAAIPTNQVSGNYGDIFTDKCEKALDTNIALTHTGIMEQTKTMKDDSQMAGIGSNQIHGHSGDTLSDKFRTEPYDNSNFSKDVSNDVLRNGNNHDLASKGECPIDGSKIAGKEYAVKRRCSQSSVSRSVLKDPFGKLAIKKEPVEMGEEASGFPEASSGKKPAMARKRGRVFSPVVKVEPDMSYDTVSSIFSNPFSAEVKSQSYLELPVDIPSPPGKKDKGRGKLVYLKDPSKRVWPVLYPDLVSVKAFSANWSKFCQHNNIKPGDECRFQLEDDVRGVYRVEVNHLYG